MEFINEVLEKIWSDRYRKNNESYYENLKRVALYCSIDKNDYQDFMWVMDHRYFFPAGRTMSNSGIGKNLTLNNCFVAGTKVLTRRGYINIEDVRIGDEVVTEDDSWQKVNEVMCREYNGDLFKISANGLYDDIICTPNHQFLTKRGWIRADRLLFNPKLVQSVDRLKLSPLTKGVLDYIAVKNVEIISDQNCKVYNLSVENVHSYVVNGVIAHNCFVAPQISDDLTDIFNKVALGARTHQRGGGIGYDFSQLRPKGTPTSNDAIASGAVSFMDVFNAQTSTILQGSRRGANMGVMNVYNMDIEDFINAKSYDENKLVHFNISVMVDDDFITAVKNDEKIYLHYPVYNDEGKIEKDPNNWLYKKEISAKYIWDLIMKKAYDNGEPGIFFYDNLNKDNNLWYIENIVCSNPSSVGGFIQ